MVAVPGIPSSFETPQMRFWEGIRQESFDVTVEHRISARNLVSDAVQGSPLAC